MPVFEVRHRQADGDWISEPGISPAVFRLESLARELGVPLIVGAELPVDARFRVAMVRSVPADLRHILMSSDAYGLRIAVAPATKTIGQLRGLLDRAPELRRHLVLTTGDAIRRTIDANRRHVLRDIAKHPERLLEHAGIDTARIGEIVEASRATGIDPYEIAYRRGLMTGRRLATALAQLTGCRLVDRFSLMSPDNALQPADYRCVTTAAVRVEDQVSIAAAPAMDTLPRLLRLIEQDASNRNRIVVLSNDAVNSALRTHFAARDCGCATVHLAHRAGTWSAEKLITGRQLAVTAVATAVSGAGAVVLPHAAFLATELASLGAIFAVSTLRAAAFLRPEPSRRKDPPLSDEALPVYSVLVPLYRERGTIPDLLTALSNLDYPPEKLDIKMIVEADDGETLASIAAFERAPFIETIVVPLVGPRTKPKALQFALPLCHGEIVTIYDAEDRPERDQLRRTAAAFAAGPPDLGCIQARLAIDHPEDTWFTRHFALEYAALFDGLLPWMAARKLAFPLGGTSNHIKRKALIEAGGWDPFNVTEDADLGFRLARFGWRSAVVESTTWEEAPLGFKAWFAQRTRWYKGWLQTWLVHMRSPTQLWRDLGGSGFAMFQILIGGGIIVLMLNLLFALTLCLYAVGLIVAPRFDMSVGSLLLLLHAGIGLGGVIAPALLIRQTARRRGFSAPLSLLATLPVYWLLMALALVAGVVDLIRRPVHWAKTVHGLAVRPSKTIPRRRSAPDLAPGKTPAAARRARC